MLRGINPGHPICSSYVSDYTASCIWWVDCPKIIECARVGAIPQPSAERREEMGKEQQQAMAYLHQRYFGTDFTYEVSKERDYCVSRLAAVASIEPVAAPSVAPSAPGQFPCKVIVFPTRSNDATAKQLPAPREHPGRVIVFPGPNKNSGTKAA